MCDVTNNCSPAGSEAGGDDEIETGSEGAESTSSSTAMSCDEEARGEEMLHVFSGRPRVGGFEDGAETRGVRVTSVDLLLGGAWHDIRLREVRMGLISQVRERRYSVVWIGLP